MIMYCTQYRTSNASTTATISHACTRWDIRVKNVRECSNYTSLALNMTFWGGQHNSYSGKALGPCGTLKCKNNTDVKIPTNRLNHVHILVVDTVDVLFFAGTYFRGQLSPKQFAGIKIRATSTGCDIYTMTIYICGY